MTLAAYSNANIFPGSGHIVARLDAGETREELIAAGYHRITVNRTYWRWMEKGITAGRGAGLAYVEPLVYLIHTHSEEPLL